MKAAGVPVNDGEHRPLPRGTKQEKTERMVYWMAQTVAVKWCIFGCAMRAVSEMQYLDEARLPPARHHIGGDDCLG